MTKYSNNQLSKSNKTVKVKKSCYIKKGDINKLQQIINEIIDKENISLKFSKNETSDPHFFELASAVFFGLRPTLIQIKN